MMRGEILPALALRFEQGSGEPDPAFFCLGAFKFCRISFHNRRGLKPSAKSRKPLRGFVKIAQTFTLRPRPAQLFRGGQAQDRRPGGLIWMHFLWESFLFFSLYNLLSFVLGYQLLKLASLRSIPVGRQRGRWL